MFGSKITFKTTLKGAGKLLNSAIGDLWMPFVCLVLLIVSFGKGLQELVRLDAALIEHCSVVYCSPFTFHFFDRLPSCGLHAAYHSGQGLCQSIVALQHLHPKHFMSGLPAYAWSSCRKGSWFPACQVHKGQQRVFHPSKQQG